MEGFQFTVTDQCSDFFQNNQMISYNYGTKQLHDDALKYCQSVYCCIGWHFHTDFLQKRLKLSIQQLFLYELLLKAMTQNKHIICNRHRLDQRAFFLNDSDPVMCPGGFSPGVNLFSVIVNIAIIQRQIHLKKL